LATCLSASQSTADGADDPNLPWLEQHLHEVLNPEKKWVVVVDPLYLIWKIVIYDVIGYLQKDPHLH
jgi:hypothetical protein